MCGATIPSSAVAVLGGWKGSSAATGHCGSPVLTLPPLTPPCPWCKLLPNSLEDAVKLFLTISLAATACLAGTLDHGVLTGNVVEIPYGHTVTVKDAEGTNHVVRLAEIHAPVMGQPHWEEARKALAGKVGGKAVLAVGCGRDKQGRLLGKVYCGGRRINEEMVAEGHAWHYRSVQTG